MDFSKTTAIDFSRITIGGVDNPEVRFEGSLNSYIVCGYNLKKHKDDAIWWVLGFCNTANLCGGYIHLENPFFEILVDYVSTHELPIECPPMSYLEGCSVARKNIPQKITHL